MHPLSTEAEQRVDNTTSTGSGNAAQVDLPPTATNVDIWFESTGSATLTVEASTDGQTWREADSVDVGSAATRFRQYDFAYENVRAYLDQNIDELEIVGGGL